ncbi:MAG: Ig-like domain-containing protein [Candidatus Thorarchaeota archaeon]
MKTRQLLIIIGILMLIVSTAVGFTLFMNISPPEQEDLRPQITVLSPVSETTVSGTITICVNVTDEESLFSDIYIDGNLVSTANEYNWDTTQYPDGNHTLRFNVVDSALQGDVEYFEVLVDNVADETFTSDVFKIMVYNIKESGVNPNWKTVVKHENPDILVLVETGYFDDYAHEDLNAYASEFNAYFTNELPYESFTSFVDSFPTTGEAILSRFPILNFTQVDQVPLDDGSMYSVTHDFIHAEVEINGVIAHVFGGHLKASGGETNMNRRNWESEGIINYMDRLGDVPILYLSDQNSFSPDDTGDLAPDTAMPLGYGPMTMMLYPNDPVYGNYSSEVHNFTDVYRSLNPADPGYTFGHQYEDTAIRIDYIVVNQFFEGMLVNSTVPDAAPADPASDHYAVTAFINWTADPTPSTEQEDNEISTDNARPTVVACDRPIQDTEFSIEVFSVIFFRNRSLC